VKDDKEDKTYDRGTVYIMNLFNWAWEGPQDQMDTAKITELKKLCYSLNQEGCLLSKG
jgi:hypothetical protein